MKYDAEFDRNEISNSSRHLSPGTLIRNSISRLGILIIPPPEFFIVIIENDRSCLNNWCSNNSPQSRGKLDDNLMKPFRERSSAPSLTSYLAGYNEHFFPLPLVSTCRFVYSKDFAKLCVFSIRKRLFSCRLMSLIARRKSCSKSKRKRKQVVEIKSTFSCAFRFNLPLNYDLWFLDPRSPLSVLEFEFMRYNFRSKTLQLYLYNFLVIFFGTNLAATIFQIPTCKSNIMLYFSFKKLRKNKK